jgi:L-Ala-D/L-Glu epimerase
MKITAASTWVETFPLTRPYTIAFREVDTVDNVIVRLETATGLVGWGAGAPESHVTGETLEMCTTALENLEQFVGLDVRHVVTMLRTLQKPLLTTPAAKAALDMALYDLYAQYLQLPLVEVLGRVYDRLLTSITIGIKPLAETLAEAEEYIGRGFRILKVKLGKDLEEDIERLYRLREQVGPHIGMRVDPNQGYTLAELIQFVDRTEPLGLEFIEQPIAANLTETLRTLPANIRRTIALDEALLGPQDALRWVQPEPLASIFNIKLMKCGGLYPAQQMVTVAELAGIDLMWGCMDESIISIAAALHLALATPRTRYLDLDGSLDLARDLVTGGFILEEGYMRTSDRPGLGVRAL